MLSPLVILAFQLASAGAVANPLAPLATYAGEWSITVPKTPAGPARTDDLVNHRMMTDAYYTCEQVVNGKPSP